MFGGYAKETLPRVMHISVSRYRRELPQPGEALDFLVGIHEEGTGITWQQNVTVDADTQAFLAGATHDLLLWSVNLGLTPQKAARRARELGARLYQAFLGEEGAVVLGAVAPTAILLAVDETLLGLPWELLAAPEGSPAAPRGPLAEHTPLGRLVTTRMILHPGRDPLQEDRVVRILAVANPTQDLAASEAEIAALQALEGQHGAFKVEVEALAREGATRAAFAAKLAAGDYDMLHLCGHGVLDRGAPGQSFLRLADGDLTADEVLNLPWRKPPYFVFNSACESGRGAEGQRLVSAQGQTNGLAAAFLAAGVYGYAGYFWPVTEVGASLFAEVFYHALFRLENVGLAFQMARREAMHQLEDVGDLAGYSAILYGDAGSKHRRDQATAA